MIVLGVFSSLLTFAPVSVMRCRAKDVTLSIFLAVNDIQRVNIANLLGDLFFLCQHEN